MEYCEAGSCFDIMCRLPAKRFAATHAAAIIALVIRVSLISFASPLLLGLRFCSRQHLLCLGIGIRFTFEGACVPALSTDRSQGPQIHVRKLLIFPSVQSIGADDFVVLRFVFTEHLQEYSHDQRGRSENRYIASRFPRSILRFSRLCWSSSHAGLQRILESRGRSVR
jgi:hypothetical protein